MIACLAKYSFASGRAGVGFSLQDLYGDIATAAGSGQTQLGQISALLLNLGLGVEAARNALGIVANNVGSDPQALARINAELNYLNTYRVEPERNTWVLPAVVAAGLLLWVMSERD